MDGAVPSHGVDSISNQPRDLAADVGGVLGVALDEAHLLELEVHLAHLQGISSGRCRWRHGTGAQRSSRAAGGGGGRSGEVAPPRAVRPARRKHAPPGGGERDIVVSGEGYGELLRPPRAPKLLRRVRFRRRAPGFGSF